MAKFAGLAIGLLLLSLLLGYTLVRPLKKPFTVPEVAYESRYAGALYKCQETSAPVKDLLFKSIYEEDDESRSHINDKSYEEYNAAIEPIKKFETSLTKSSNDYTRSLGMNRASSYCALKSLSYWAQSDALLGKTNSQGQAVRKWVLGTLATSYAQISSDPYLDRDEKKTVEKWLGRLAAQVVNDYSTGTNKKSRKNNHLYWAGWSVAMTGVAIDNRFYFGWGLRQTRKGLADIRPDGILPLELARKSRALQYHLFATMPLVMTTYLASVNGIDLLPKNNRALDRLVKLDLEGLDNSGYFQRATGEKQDVSKIYATTTLAWLEAYNRMAPSADAEKWLIRTRPMMQNRIGGDATLLYSPSMVK